MPASALIVFREVLEAALIIGVVLAATTGVRGRSAWIVGGVLLGLAGAGVLAFFADAVSSMGDGSGRELINAGVLVAAVGMLAWHQIWMSQHGKALAGSLQSLGHSVQAGDATMRALALVVAGAVLREGSETVLFLWGLATSSEAAAAQLVGGTLVGLAAGALCGAALYLGLLRIPPRYLFGVTGWLITLLAASMAAQAGGLLVQAGYLPTLTDELWDTSGLLPQGSALGQLLHILVGYDDRPTGIQLLLYVLTAATITVLSRRLARPHRRPVTVAVR